MNERNETRRFSLWALICICASVSTVVAAGTWQVARSRIEDELAQYQRSKNWNLPEALKSLGQLSEKINVDLASRSELDSLKKQANEWSQAEHELNKRLEEMKAENSRLNKRLADLESPLVSVRKGEAKPIGHAQILVGVSTIKDYLDTAEIHVDGKTYEMKVGDSFGATAEGQLFVITLIKIEYQTCSFGFYRKM